MACYHFYISGSCIVGHRLDAIEFSYLDPTQDDTRALDAFVRAHPEGSAYHLSAWCRAVSSAYGYRSQVLVARRHGQLAGMLPLCVINRPFGSARWVSLPFCDLGGPLAEDAALAAALAARARADLGVRQLAGLELRCSSTLAEAADMDLSGRKVRMLLDLPASADELMKSYPPKLRSQVRKAAKNGLAAEVSSAPEAVAAFYDVYARNMRRLGSPPHSLAWFEAIQRHYGENGLFFVLVRHEGKVIGAGCVLVCGERAVIPWASTLADYNRLAPNMQLYDTILATVCERGVRQFDFGRSTFGEGTYKFKEQWGAQPCPLAWQEWKAGANQPQLDAVKAGPGRLRPLVEQVWQQLPLGITNSLGPRLRRYITL
jgi:FemAB-related protein (PEP-CTERM system-associated)